MTRTENKFNPTTPFDFPTPIEVNDMYGTFETIEAVGSDSSQGPVKNDAYWTLQNCMSFQEAEVPNMCANNYSFLEILACERVCVRWRVGLRPVVGAVHLRA
jgi:hypothetical protein